MNRYLIALFILLLSNSCKKFTEVDFPVNQVGSDDMFSTDAKASSAVRGIYAEMMNTPNQIANSAVTFYAGMSADELRNYVTDARDEFWKNDLTAQNHTVLSAHLWAPAYKIIYVCNLSLERLESATGLSSSLKEQLKGECLYMRALNYFLLVNLFGDVPLCLSSDYRINLSLPRTSAADVFNQIGSDLQSASILLGPGYALAERSVPNQWAAKALLAKYYLYQEKWDSVISLSSQVLQSGSYQIVSNLNQVFLKGSMEVLWQLHPTVAMRNSWEGYAFVPLNDAAVPNYFVTAELLQTFEDGDLRKENWIKQRSYAGNTIFYPNKYKVKQNSVVTEGQVVMRLAEVLLMRAEAYQQKNQIALAVRDMNILRGRAGLTAVSENINPDSCRRLLRKERRIELLAEWGNRWMDLKRWNIADSVLRPVKGAAWAPTDVMYPIPQLQIELNRNLVQNPGY